MNQWDDLAENYGLNVLAQKNILWPKLTKTLKPIFKDSRILDIGCGNGAYTRFFHEHGSNIIGIDNSNEQINLAQKINPGPKYYQASAQEYNSTSLFENLLANMVVCNISSEEDLLDFFENLYNISTENAHLFITNVAPNYQRTCKTKALIQSYPSNTIEGAEFDVSLATTTETIGPFKNYYWSKQKIADVAEIGGWRLIESTKLLFDDAKDDVWPEYILFEYCRK